MAIQTDRTDHAREVSLRELLQAFGIIGVTSFGGGLTGWIYREIVEKRRWLSEQDFFSGLALARTLPGANVVNLSIWIGDKLRGRAGVVAALSGVLVGPLLLISVCAVLYQRWGHSPWLHRALLGVAAAALALGLNMSLKGMRVTAKDPVHATILLLTFVGVGVMHWPMLPVVAILIPASVAWTFLRGPRQ